ncbi:5'-nucleotidase C-terminal domain-containing protein [bacterium]|nr:5'-nucleotidase C-terminal domain-containing protein [bacterium]
MLAVLCLGLGLSAALPRAAMAQAEGVNISILYTGDTHGHLESFAGDGEKPMGGVAKRAIYFQEKRRHKKMTWLTLDSGDALSGTPLSDAFQGYLDIEAMNRLGYDAMCLGVHDFDYGVGVLKQRMSEAKFAVLSANIISRDTGSSFAKPYTIIERDGLRIAVFGLTTTEIASRAAAKNFEGLTVQDPEEVAKSLVPELRAKADIVVALTHMGVNEDIRLASKVPGIDVIVGGMSHSELQVPMKVGQTLVVHDGFYGKNVGLLKLSFKPDSNGRLTRSYFDSSLEPMGGRYKENSDYLTWLASYAPGLNERMAVVIGSSTTRMAAVKAKSSETDMGNFVCDVLRDYCSADVAILPAGFFRAGLPEGPVTLGDLFTALPFDHYAMKLTVTGGELQEILNDAADQIGRPGFPQISGLKMALFNGKAYYIKVNNENLDPFARYSIATSDMLAEGGSGYSTLGTIKERSYTGRLVRDIIKERIKNGTPVQSGVFSRITFMADAPAGADTSEPEVRDEAPVEEETLADESPAADEEMASADEQPAAEEEFIPDETVDEGVSDERLGRDGEPLSDETVSDETVTDESISEEAGEMVDESVDEAVDEAGEMVDEGVDEVLGEATEEAEGVVPEADGPGSEEIGEDLPPVLDEEGVDEGSETSSASSGDMFIGSATANNGDVDYEFSVERMGGEYIFTLHVVNNGDKTASMSYSDAAFFDFMVYDGNNLLWNFNHNRFFMQKPRVEPLGPGESRNFSGRWNGRSNAGQNLAPKVYRFEALHLLSEGQQRAGFEAEI